MGDVIQLRRKAAQTLPRAAAVIVGPLLAIAIVLTWLLAALLQSIADCCEGSQM